MLLQFKRGVWGDLLSELERRSDKRVESGAFLLGQSLDGVRSVQQCVYYDDLFPDALHPTHVYVPSDAYQVLWGICERTGCRVVADVHTHPGLAIQSETDSAHPMIPEVGHVAIILPRFARPPLQIRSIGLYEYLGAFEWRRIPESLIGSTLEFDETTTT